MPAGAVLLVKLLLNRGSHQSDHWQPRLADRSRQKMAARELTSGLHHLTLSARTDRKSTRLNSSHSQISYAVFCLKKKKQKDNETSAKNTNPITATST